MWIRAKQTRADKRSHLELIGAEQLGLHYDELTMDSFSVVVNLDRISPRFEDQGSKSDPTDSSSLSLFFLPTS